MAEFALGSLATMVEVNPRIQIPGHVPYLGSRLNIFQRRIPFLILLFSIPVTHLILLVVTLWFTRSVVVADDSFMVIAGLLNKTERPMQGEGRALGGTAHNSNGVIYGPLSMPDENYVLHIGENVKPLKQWDHKRHPDGSYVGLVEKRDLLGRMARWMAGRR